MTTSAVRLLFVAALACAGAPAPAAESTPLRDETNVLRLDAPGTWRPLDGPYAFAAAGFLAAVKRTEVFAVLYADLKDASLAAKRWKDARVASAPAAEFTNPRGDPLRWISVEPSKKTVDYCRALEGVGMSAVVWARLTGEPGVAQEEAFALLDAATLERPGGPVPKTATQAFKDRDHALELSLPPAFQERKPPVNPSERVVLTLKGPVGSDPEASLDVYAMPDFDRADACGWWWIEGERRGWRSQGVRVEGEPPSFRVLVNGETWTRHVRVLPTKAGVYALRLDVESAADEAGAAFLDELVEGKSLAVTKPRSESPVAGPGLARLDAEAHVVLHEVDPAAATAIGAEAGLADAAVGKVLGLAPADSRKGVVRIVKDDGMDAVLRPLGGPAGRSAWWSVGTREVIARQGVLATDATRAELAYEAAREAAQRRFGFRPPFWVEHGVARLAESAAYQKGRLDQVHPGLADSARDAVGVNIDFETVRWWTEADSGGNPEREAIVWGFWLLFTEPGAVSQKWAEPLKSYLAKLRQTGSPAAATRAFPYERDAELVEDFKKRMKKVER